MGKPVGARAAAMVSATSVAARYRTGAAHRQASSYSDSQAAAAGAGAGAGTGAWAGAEAGAGAEGRSWQSSGAGPGATGGSGNYQDMFREQARRSATAAADALRREEERMKADTLREEQRIAAEELRTRRRREAEDALRAQEQRIAAAAQGALRNKREAEAVAARKAVLAADRLRDLEAIAKAANAKARADAAAALADAWAADRSFVEQGQRENAQRQPQAALHRSTSQHSSTNGGGNRFATPPPAADRNELYVRAVDAMNLLSRSKTLERGGEGGSGGIGGDVPLAGVRQERTTTGGGGGGGEGGAHDVGYVSTKAAWPAAAGGSAIGDEGGQFGDESSGDERAGGLMGRLIRKAKKPPSMSASVSEANFNKL